MKGKILDYNIQESKGVISGDDGQRYSFENKDWKASELPKVNQIVDFEIDEEYAKKIYILQSESTLKYKGGISISFENKIGIGICVFLILTYFIVPIRNIIVSDGWFGSKIGSQYSLINHDFGIFALIATIICGYLFFTEAKKAFIEINTVIVGILVTYILYDYSTLFYNLLRVNIKYIEIPTLTIFILAICLVVVGFKDKK
jgi:hypothetical protein